MHSNTSVHNDLENEKRAHLVQEGDELNRKLRLNIFDQLICFSTEVFAYLVEILDVLLKTVPSQTWN